MHAAPGTMVGACECQTPIRDPVWHIMGAWVSLFLEEGVAVHACTGIGGARVPPHRRPTLTPPAAG